MRFLTRAGAVAAAWTVLVFGEQAYVLLGARAAFAGSWEISTVRWTLTPLALLLLAPLAVPVVALGIAVARRPRLLPWLAAALAGLLAFGISGGRHFASVPVRASFVLVLAVACGVAVRYAAGAFLRFVRTRPGATSAGGLGVAAVAWWLDGHAYAHLYAAAHGALLAVTLLATALAARPLAETRARVGSALLAAGFVATLLAVPLVGGLSRKLATADNVRFIALEHGPLLGRVVQVAASIAPPAPLDDDPRGAPSTPPPGEIPRALDWSGHDLLLVTIDALRADHVSSYGYARQTTPEIDRLAGEGTAFRAAYCPTPHTSYSITSMMTGKYMRPLLSLGLGEDSETWAGAMRRYDFRTAAFYPPAVFFVDEERFVGFAERGLDFEYRRVEFKDAGLRSAELGRYLQTAPAGRPLFVWVHLFEPHEPYIFHPDHPFGDAHSATDVDRYDSEVATADAAVGDLVRTMRAARPNVVVIVTADHGEAFGEHGARYHGGDVHDEQVRVPLVVVGPGVTAKVEGASVQTIDLLPTVLSALGMPRPARIRGRDLGPLLAAKSSPDPAALPAGYPPPLAFSETDDYARVTHGTDVLICQRQVRACALYDRARDPGELRDVTGASPEKAQDLRRLLTGIERDNGRFERGEGADWPEPIRRGLQGDVTAAEDVAPLLDDAQLAVRQEAADVLYRLHDAATAAALRRALARDEDATVRRFAALGVARAALEEPAPALVETLLHDSDVTWRRRAALTFAERGDARGEAELVAEWSELAPSAASDGKDERDATGANRAALASDAGTPHPPLTFEQARTLLAAIRKARVKGAAPVLARSLGDVRLRADIATTLGVLGVKETAPALLAAFTEERYVSARAAEGNALVSLGMGEELRAPLQRFAGVPEPMPESLELAARAGLLKAPSGWHAPHQEGAAGGGAAPLVAVMSAVRLPTAAAESGLRLLLAVSKNADPVHVDVDHAGERLATVVTDTLQEVELPSSGSSSLPDTATAPLAVSTREPVVAAWLVPRAAEIPPPPPRPWRPN